MHCLARSLDVPDVSEDNLFTGLFNQLANPQIIRVYEHLRLSHARMWTGRYLHVLDAQYHQEATSCIHVHEFASIATGHAFLALPSWDSGTQRDRGGMDELDEGLHASLKSLKLACVTLAATCNPRNVRA
jgi:hypothetical protein